jgi:hypothetical protein
MIMEKKIKQYIKALLVALVPLAFASCEINGPLAHYKVVVNEKMIYIPSDMQLQLAELNREFKTVPYEKKDAIERFDDFCYSLQSYYDDNQGMLIWGNLVFDVSLYNTTSDKGTGEGLLVKSHIITYHSK